MYTGSEHATRLLRDWDEILPRFVKVMPIDYRKALERMAQGGGEKTESRLRHRRGLPLMAQPTGFMDHPRVRNPTSGRWTSG